MFIITIIILITTSIIQGPCDPGRAAFCINSSTPKSAPSASLGRECMLDGEDLPDRPIGPPGHLWCLAAFGAWPPPYPRLSCLARLRQGRLHR